jgi:hypothetical protein
MRLRLDPTMKRGDRSSLFRALRRAWSRSTSADPAGWTASNPAWGQCAITALAVQDVLGGRLVRTVVDGTSHYYNLLDNGEEVDLTREQFGAGPVVSARQIRDRSYVLSFPDTANRYLALKAAASSGAPRRHAIGTSSRRRSNRLSAPDMV